jgi:hypothetical protein
LVLKTELIYFRDLDKCTADCSCPEDSGLVGCYAISIGKYYEMMYRLIAPDGVTVL